ncbi:AAA family ATPase [Fictibacillus sp. KIGAM418]|uniref:AAA family ATPase n=1 Tax=Fictibacillus marinisediminis TaxID=2878389 RepID=A0A9X2BHQ5_9BACL|nr:AAA family ATPase [Fictibacillus marinisediminis]MCK6259512.1 AAA family ATPase [Fictibacillus marinisediminis]
MIETIYVKHGQSTSQLTLPIEGDKITIFVGPNNSGKSLILREIESYFNNISQDFKLLENIDLKMPTPEELNNYYEYFKMNDSRYVSNPGYVYLMKRTVDGKIEPLHINKHLIENALSGDKSHYQYLLQHYHGMFLLRLDGSTRFNLTSPQEGGDLGASPSNILMALFINDESRLKIREIIADAFGKYFVIDPTSMLTLRIKLSDNPPVDKSEEQALDFRARKFHNEAMDIKDLSDGIKAFTGIVTSVFSGDSKIILIDEPEAFLHPPLARKLGLRLAQLAPERNATLVAATHSSDFIMGCIQSGKEVNIIRLTYQDGVSSAKLLPSSDLTSLMKDPLLRSTGVLSSLFHDTVIITESDADRAFYQEINERLISFGNKGLNSCLFLNAQNKQTIYRILGPLRNLGIRTAAIVDIDVVKEGGQVWANLLRSAHVPSTLIEPLNILRNDVKQYFQNTGRNMKRDGGIQLLEEDEKAACQNLFDQLASYGIFIIPNGELESWLKNFGVAGHGPAWLMSIFEKMGSNPDDTDYVKPFNGDVWGFIEKIAKWSDK